ncbi:hypothetical protein H7170_01580 [Candidatus Gracilibacteria bacterium]|nr:hypothetical protein [Candidatus Gracilibacteria bacterium]
MNSIFHINIFSQVSPTLSSGIDSGDAVVAAPSEGGNSGTSKIRTAVATGLLALSLSAGAQERPIVTALADTYPILLAQASTETDGKVYTAEVIQVDGTKKTVKYFRDARGGIIAPPVIDGKLVDGSNAPDNAVEARIAQKKILVKYDRSAQIMLASVSKEDLFGVADKTLKEILTLTEQGKIITKEQLASGFYSVYILTISVGDSNGKGKTIISSLESIARVKLGMKDSEISQIKGESEIKAKNIWKSVTGAIA